MYCRREDKTDLDKLEVGVLMHNQSTDKYFYQLLVFTGIRRKSEANTRVEFTLSGTNDTTDICVLFNSHKKVFQRGSIDSFLLAVPQSLGNLKNLRIWLNNSADDRQASWFLKYFIVRDLQTMEKFHFICQQWFVAERINLSSEYIFPLASDSQKHDFRLNISDEHLWFSIFSRSLSSHFTRVQRCTCCFVLLFTSMLLNILYYDQTRELKTSTNLHTFSIGPFQFGREQISVGIICDILLFVPSLCLVMLFRRIRRRRSIYEVSPILRVLAQLQPWKILTTNQRKKKTIRSLPWWSLFFAYGFSLMIFTVSILVIIARGIEFGDEKVQQWLAAILTSFLSSILLTQPIKVLIMTIMFVLFYRRTNLSKKKKIEYIDKNEDFYFNGDEERIEPIGNYLAISNKYNEDEIELRNRSNVQPKSVKFSNRSMSAFTMPTQPRLSLRSTSMTDFHVEDLDN